MDIAFTKSSWEFDPAAYDDPIDAFATRTAGDGFDGVELFLPLIDDEPGRIIDVLDDHGLHIRIIDIVTEGHSPNEHRQSFDDAVRKALEFRPAFINSHTGRDIFSFAENLNLFVHAITVSENLGIPILHETHRTRPTYTAIDTCRFIEELPQLHLTADLSHWMVVHESDLSDLEATVDCALERSRHIHARVGFEQGPQVNDPRAPEWKGHVERHIELWQRIADHCRDQGVDVLTITPEFGPDPYAPVQPYSREPLVDVWDANVHMKDLLTTRLT